MSAAPFVGAGEYGAGVVHAAVGEASSSHVAEGVVDVGGGEAERTPLRSCCDWCGRADPATPNLRRTHQRVPHRSLKPQDHGQASRTLGLDAPNNQSARTGAHPSGRTTVPTGSRHAHVRPVRLATRGLPVVSVRVVRPTPRHRYLARPLTVVREPRHRHGLGYSGRWRSASKSLRLFSFRARCKRRRADGSCVRRRPCRVACCS